MCGIFGFVGDPATARSIDLAVAIHALRHRGPDGSATFRDDRGDVTACALAHTRLAIIDLSPAGAQPMTTSDGRYTIVYNGEIYNFRDLRRQLEALGQHFVSSGDTEVVLKGFQQWGKTLAERLRGMFAFAIWDRERRSLFFARDRIGVKPFYFMHSGGRFAFASEVRALLATKCAEPRFCEKGLRSYFEFGSVADPDTILQDVQALLPGHCGEIAGGTLRLWRYWQLPARTSAEATDSVNEMRVLLDEAVSNELVSDVPLGVFLSGGMDSSAITAVASKHSSQPLQTFTVTFAEEEFNEAGYAAEVAAHFGCDHHQVHIPPERAVTDVERVLSALDQPSSDGINTFVVAEAARQAGLTVALSGLGGDEVFAGYRHFQTFAWLRRHRRMTSALAAVLGHGHSNGSPFGGRRNWMRKATDILAAKGEPFQTYAALRSMFTSQQRAALLRFESDRSALADNDDTEHDPVNLFSRLEISNYTRNTLLRDADVMSMAHSLEVRVPLLDHILIERVLAIPGSVKIGRTVNKPLLRDAAPDVPPAVAGRPKMGFVLPLDHWFRGSLKSFIEELLLGEPVKRLEFLNRDSVARMWKAFLDSDRYISHSRIWCVAALAGWAERNGIRG